MDTQNRPGSRFIGIVAAIVGMFFLYGMGAEAVDKYKVTRLFQSTKSVCVGRFLIDLPAEMDFSYRRAFLSGFWITAIPESHKAFLHRVAAREATIDAQPNELGKKNMEKSETFAMNGFESRIFTFGRTSVEGLEHGQTVHYVNVALEGYAHAENTTFSFTANVIAPEHIDTLRTMMGKLRVLAPGEIPSAPGFCFGRGMFVDPVPIEWTEGVAMFAGFRDHPDLAMVFNTRAGLGKDPYDPGRLARTERADAELALWQRASLKKLRVGHRIINGISGEEVLDRGTELNFVNVYLFDWEVIGTKDNVFVPDMHLEMSTGHPVRAGARPVPSFLGEEALIHLWDRISSSIRVRPTCPAPQNVNCTVIVSR